MPNARRILTMLLPPICLDGARFVRNVWRRNAFESAPVFDAPGIAVFRKHLGAARSYLEYGCGGSTLMALRESRARVVSVDTSAEWVARCVQRAGADADRLDLRHVDLGPVGAWGTPVDYSHRARFEEYVSDPWSREAAPSFVLVDGRFRVACCLKSLLCAPRGTPILFDDYVIVPYYHVLEEVVRPSETHGKMAVFHADDALDRDKAQRMLAEFLMVRD